ncbi:MAG: hypothetical protein V8S90_11500 [Lachnospiraceae bacterium]
MESSKIASFDSLFSSAASVEEVVLSSDAAALLPLESEACVAVYLVATKPSLPL